MKLSLVLLAWAWSLLIVAFLFSGHPPVWQSLQRDLQWDGIEAAMGLNGTVRLWVGLDVDGD